MATRAAKNHNGIVRTVVPEAWAAGAGSTYRRDTIMPVKAREQAVEAAEVAWQGGAAPKSSCGSAWSRCRGGQRLGAWRGGTGARGLGKERLAERRRR